MLRKKKIAIGYFTTLSSFLKLNFLFEAVCDTNFGPDFIRKILVLEEQIEPTAVWFLSTVYFWKSSRKTVLNDSREM
jgi:hypothetical protein